MDPTSRSAHWIEILNICYSPCPRQHYHHQWVNHGATWRTSDDSVAGIFEAFDEFQNRSLNDPKAVFVFLSNFWDAYAYENHKARTIPPYVWLDDYKANYTRIVSGMKRRLRPGVDCLVLQTSHAVGGQIHTYALMINAVVKEIATELGLPLFPVDEIVRNCPVETLIDKLHLAKAYNVIVANELLRYLNVYRICDNI